MAVVRVHKEAVKVNCVASIASEFQLTLSPAEYVNLVALLGSSAASPDTNSNLFGVMSSFIEKQLNIRYMSDLPEYIEALAQMKKRGTKLSFN